MEHYSQGAKVEGGEDDDSDEDDDGDWDAELEEDIYFETILDTVDPYKTFATVLLGKKVSAASVLCSFG